MVKYYKTEKHYLKKTETKWVLLSNKRMLIFDESNIDESLLLNNNITYSTEKEFKQQLEILYNTINLDE